MKSNISFEDTPPKVKAHACKIMLECRDMGFTLKDMLFLQREIQELLDELQGEVELKKLSSLP